MPPVTQIVWYNIAMIRKLVLLSLFFILAVPAAAEAYETYRAETFSTGKDWVERMTVREKYIALVPPTLLFHRYNIHFRRSLPEYVSLIDRVMAYNPQLATEDVANIFISTVHLYEPELRPAIKMLELQFLQGNYEQPSYTGTPLRETLEELIL